MDAKAGRSSQVARSLAPFLISQYEVLHLILSCLPMRDLNHAAQVCRAWCKAAQVVKKERMSVHWLLWHLPGLEESVEKSGGMQRNGVYLPMILPSDHVPEFVSRNFEEVYSEPDLGLIFCTSVFMEEQKVILQGDRRAAKKPRWLKSKNPAIGFFKNILPGKCTVLGVGAPGIVGTAYNLSYSIEVENKEALSVFMLPKIPGVSIRHFVINENKDLDVSQEVLPPDKLHCLTGITPEEHVKCLLLFCNMVDFGGGEGAKLVANTLFERQNHDIAIGGGFVDSLMLPQASTIREDNIPTTVGLSISGPRVTATSTVIRRSIKKPSGVEMTIQELKKCNLPEEKSFAFMFACMARGEGLYGRGSVESNIFRKYFPNTPLFGFFGNGEIGIDHMRQFRCADDTSKMSKIRMKSTCSSKRKQEYFHGYTTIIVFVSLAEEKAEET